MQDQSNRAGRFARQKSNRKYNSALKIAIGILAVASVIFILIVNNKIYKISGGLVLILLLLLFIPLIFPKLFTRHIDKNLSEHRTWGQGAAGEEYIGNLLSQLGPDFSVLHDWQSPHGNIDHIVYDHRGNIFMLETKSHRGRVEVRDGQLLRSDKPFEKDFIKQALTNTYWLKEKVEKQLGLTAWIIPVIVFTNAFVPFGPPIKGVHYMNKKFLLQFLREHTGGSPAGLKLWESKSLK